MRTMHIKPLVVDHARNVNCWGVLRFIMTTCASIDPRVVPLRLYYTDQKGQGRTIEWSV